MRAADIASIDDALGRTHTLHNTGMIDLESVPGGGWTVVSWAGVAIGGPRLDDGSADGPAGQGADYSRVMPGSPIDPRDLRVSDDERSHVLTLLEKATGRGLIDLGEYTERSAKVIAARTRRRSERGAAGPARAADRRPVGR